jgi:hypothetical protein
MAAPVHLNIPEPCHENWQQMTPNEQGRHCMSCQKTVVDFTLMSDQGILDYISRASTSVCGRFNNDQLDKTYAEKKVKPVFSFRYAWNVVVATFLLTGSAATAQTSKTLQKKAAVEKKGKPKINIQPKTQGEVKSVKLNPNVRHVTLGIIGVPPEAPTRYEMPALKIFGFIRDSATKKPVGFASVRVKGTKAGISADENGRYELPMVDGSGRLALVVSAIGYATREYIVNANSFKETEILLTAAADELSPVVVIAGPVMGKIVRINPEVKKDNSTCTVTLGGVTTSIKVTKFEKIKREINEWLPTKKDVRIYPNPVTPGNLVNVSLNLNKTGEYKVELLDAGGRLVYVQALQVAERSQVAQVPTQSSWSKGVYWLRISRAGEKKIYQAKVLLQ